jgi:hypothetical protein
VTVAEKREREVGLDARWNHGSWLIPYDVPPEEQIVIVTMVEVPMNGNVGPESGEYHPTGIYANQTYRSVAGTGMQYLEKPKGNGNEGAVGFPIDVWVLAATIALVTIGILFIYSSGVTSTGFCFTGIPKTAPLALTGLVLLFLSFYTTS